MYDELTIILARMKLLHRQLLHDTIELTDLELAKGLCSIILEELEIDIEDIEEELWTYLILCTNGLSLIKKK